MELYQHIRAIHDGLPRSDAFRAINDSARVHFAAMMHMQLIRAAALSCAALLVAAALSPPVCSKPAAARRVGSMLLEPCAGVAAYCGRLDRPLDPTGVIPGRISIYFEFYPHTAAGPSIGTLVATEGGPGYAATASRDEYLELWKPLRSHRDFVLMDNRGTGNSGAVDCADLQAADHWTVELIAACGESLGDRAALYSTAYAADDLAAVLAVLGAGKIDLYGDSYGTYFEQIFALRHPDTLRSIVLDGAYPVDGPDYAWYPTYAPAMRAKFDIACRRAPECAALAGASLDHIRPAIERLRAHPFAAHAADSDGNERTFIADPSHLATVMFSGAPALAPVRELDAAARSFLEGDQKPLLRLMAETISGVDSRDPATGITRWSAGLAAAVMCQDPPQIFDMRLAPALRAADRDRALAERRRSAPDTYAPFSIDEFRGMPLDYSFIDECVAWPVSPPGHPASHAALAVSPYPDVPALVLSGELDAITTPADGAAVARVFKRGRQVLIANSFHVNALPHARSRCGADIVRRFVATLDAGNTDCASQVPPVRLAPRFAVRADQIPPATAMPSNLAGPNQLSVVRVGVLTVGDILTRVGSNSTGRGPGLRGGRFTIVHHDLSERIVLTGVRWTEDVAVSGVIEKSRGTEGSTQAAITIDGPDASGHLDIRWREGGLRARARIRGLLGGVNVSAETPAP